VSGVCLPDVSQAGVVATCRWGAAEDAPTTPVVMGSSGGAIVCSSAAAVGGAAGPTPLYLATNATASEAAAGFRATGLTFEYYALAAVRLAPVAGPVAGGTWIRVRLAMSASEDLREQVYAGGAAEARCRISSGDEVLAPFAPLHAYISPISPDISPISPLTRCSLPSRRCTPPGTRSSARAARRPEARRGAPT